MSKLAARVRTGTTLALAAAALLWIDGLFPAGWVALVVVTGLAFLGAWELDRMGSFRGQGLGLGLYGAVAGLAVASGVLLGPLASVDARLGMGLFYLLAWGIAAGLSREADVLRIVVPWTSEGNVRGTMLALWLLPPLFAIVLIDRDFGRAGLVVLVVLAKIGDNAGFFVGRALGKRHPFPNISPGKTVAGCVASLVAGIAVGAVMLPLTLGSWTPAQVALGALTGGLINVAAQAGDLSESWVKRKAGVKDSSALVGPSGGVLDVIDSLLLASPVALLIWSWVY